MNPNLDPAPGRVMCADSVGRTLLALAVPPELRTDDILTRVPVLGRRAELPEDLRQEVLAADAAEEAVPLSRIPHIDAGQVAAWIVGHYPAATYPAAILGSPHGAAVHLAAACGAVWLPTSFTVTAPWPGGSAWDWPAAMSWGARLASGILARNPGVTVRQVHDPVVRGALCGATVSLQVRWRELPAAYRSFLRTRVPGGTVLLVRDLRTWPVREGPGGYSFQVGTPAGGWTVADYREESPGFRQFLNPGVARQYAEASGERSIEPELRQIAGDTGSAFHRVFYTDPQVLSAGVADLYRARLSARPHHAVVVTGRMMDPWCVIDGAMVPYWCESSSQSAAQAAELWLAGSEQFDAVTVVLDPPGTCTHDTATLRQWRAVAGFARRHATVDRLVADRYPRLPSPARHAGHYLRSLAAVSSRPAPMPAGEAVRQLREAAVAPGLFVL